MENRCPLCWDQGERICEDVGNNGRLFSWPCPRECRPGGVALVRTTMTAARAMKLGNRMRKVRPEA